MSSVKKNYIYSLLYQIMNIIVPLITTPYLARTLGAEQIGVYSFTSSIVQYFILISMLGIVDYGNRTIASVKDKESRGRVFEEIYLVQFGATLVSVVAYIIYICNIDKKYFFISFIQGILLLASLLDVNWFFWGIEKFKITVIRNIIIKITSLIIIFVFVKSEHDLWKYVLIVTGSIFISNFILCFFLKQELILTKINIRDASKHILPCFVLMIPLVSRSIFVYMDKTMLGILSGMLETGYYEYSEKIILACTSILTPLGTVMLPRISNLLAQRKENEAQKYTELSLDFVACLGSGLLFGLVAISDILVVVFLGEDYVNCSKIVNIMAVTILLVGWTNVIRTQYILPYKKDKTYMLAVFGGALVDFIINLILIPRYGAWGASVGWVAAEVIITGIQTYFAGRKLPIFQYINNCKGYFVNGVIMCFILKIIPLSFDYMIGNLMFKVIIGAGVYVLLCLIYIRRSRKEVWELVSKKLSS